MNRRAFIVAFVSAAWSRLGHAQQHREADRIRRIGVLVAPAENDPETQRRLTVFARKLQDLGWAEGRNVQIERRFAAGDADRMQQYARELVALQPDLIVAATSRPATLLRQETSTLPILFVFVSDPIGSGLAASMARPGGNMTGFTDIEDSLSGKWLELLKEIAPGVTRVAFLFNPDTMSGAAAYFLRPFEAAAPKLGIDSLMLPVRTLPRSRWHWEDFRVSRPRSHHRSRCVHDGASRINSHLGGWTQSACNLSFSVFRSGGRADFLWHRCTRSVAPSGSLRRPHPQKPADLPVQAPTKFELVINMKTAKALSISIPPALLARADELID